MPDLCNYVRAKIIQATVPPRQPRERCIAAATQKVFTETTYVAIPRASDRAMAGGMGRQVPPLFSQVILAVRLNPLRKCQRKGQVGIFRV